MGTKEFTARGGLEAMEQGEKETLVALMEGMVSLVERKDASKFKRGDNVHFGDGKGRTGTVMSVSGNRLLVTTTKGKETVPMASVNQVG